MDKREVFQKAIDLINGSKHVLVTTHTRPDGDACGCVAAIRDVLEGLGKKVELLMLSEIPQWYRFLFQHNVPILTKDVAPEQLGEGAYAQIDLVIIVDTNSYSQLPNLEGFLRNNHKPVLVIDHHVTSDGLGTVELIDTGAAAAGLLVLDLFKAAGWPIGAGVADSLFVAVATDTGWFHFSNTDSRAYTCAAELIAAGANPSELYKGLYQNFSVARFRLMVTMLEHLELHFEGRYAAQYLGREDFERTGAAYSDTENLIDECRRIGTVEAAALFVELKDGRIRCSLRSTGGVDVREIAQKFGGGGHKMAAGTYLPGPLDNAKKIIYQEMAKELLRG